MGTDLTTVPERHLYFSTMTSDGLAGKTEAFFRVGVTPRLELGFGYLAKQQTLRPLANYTFLTETAKRPALVC